MNGKLPLDSIKEDCNSAGLDEKVLKLQRVPRKAQSVCTMPEHRGYALTEAPVPYLNRRVPSRRAYAQRRPSTCSTPGALLPSQHWNSPLKSPAISVNRRYEPLNADEAVDPATHQNTLTESPFKFVSTYSLAPADPYYDEYANHPHDKTYTSLPQLLNDFCARTSSHGIPHIAESYTLLGKLFWSVVFICCGIAFTYQTYWTIERYIQFNTIIEMDLKFEPAPFPAVTICNLNPYKFSLAIDIPNIEKSFKLFKSALNKSGEIKKQETAQLQNNSMVDQINQIRSKRQVSYEPIIAKCKCSEQPDADQTCLPLRNPLDRRFDTCICFHDVFTGDIWPCYRNKEWGETLCDDCGDSHTCKYPSTPVQNTSGRILLPCLCQALSHLCVVKPQGWYPRWYLPHAQHTTHKVTPRPPPPTTPTPEIEEAVGVKDVKDKAVITMRTKETLIFVVASLEQEIRRQLSYNLREFVLQCSFNGKDCNMDRDFRLQQDPIFGNCFTFNYNSTVQLTNSRAGPMYGLRLMLDVNQSDYWPTTEGAGIRMVVHQQTDEPFPDTFGYSAPVGFISSFGLKTKKMSRMGPPWGKCVSNYTVKNYIYDEQYSTEGCYRSCFQHNLVDSCGCGDPRFPLPKGRRACDALSNVERNCVNKVSSQTGGFRYIKKDCACVQPCEEYIFETAYSSSHWPADKYETGDCPESLGNETCIEYLRRNTAFVEIYYEQLNFENLREKEAYGIVNLLSDFGGNIGLWIGFSIITVIEFFELLLELFYLCYYRNRKEKRRRQSESAFQMHYVNRVSENTANQETATTTTANAKTANAVRSHTVDTELNTP